jgi:Flp pilus assembly protein TadB
MPELVSRAALHSPKHPSDFLSLEQTLQEEKPTNGCKTEAERRFFCGCLIIAAGIAIAFQSWLAFAIALAVGLSLKAHDCGIRLERSSRKRRAKRRECR